MNRLITDFWAQDCQSAARALELRECLRENGNTAWLDQLLLFCRDTKAAKAAAQELGLPESKVCFVFADNRITYQQVFNSALNFVTRHHHKTGYRTYRAEDKVLGPGRYTDVVKLAIK
jgi:hypothetical protein